MKFTQVTITNNEIHVYTVIEYVNKEHIRFNGKIYKVPDTCKIEAGYRDRDRKFKLESLKENTEYCGTITIANQILKSIEYIEEYQPKEEREDTETHESWGVITMSRPHNSGVPLFMTEDDDIRSVVDINISQAVASPMNQGVCSDKYYVRDGKNILSIRMSFAQWLKFISNQTGTQTPCTITTFLYSLESVVEKWEELVTDRDLNKEAK